MKNNTEDPYNIKIFNLNQTKEILINEIQKIKTKEELIDNLNYAICFIKFNCKDK